MDASHETDNRRQRTPTVHFSDTIQSPRMHHPVLEDRAPYQPSFAAAKESGRQAFVVLDQQRSNNNNNKRNNLENFSYESNAARVNRNIRPSVQRGFAPWHDNIGTI